MNSVPSQAQATLTSQQLAGQRVIFSYPGLMVPSALLQQISAGQAAGVIFFGGNISSESQIASVVQQLRQAQQQSPVSSPLLLMTDQEGGEVRRLPGAPTMSEKQIGEAKNPASAASQAGTGAGQNLAGVGMNVNRQLRAAGRARRPGRDGPAAVLGPGPHRGPGGRHRPGRCAGRGAA